MHAQIGGVLFQDDAYLSDFEDFNPAALNAFNEHIDRIVSIEELLPDAAMSGEWTRFKTQGLMTFTDELIAAVRRHRPGALFARNIYTRLLTQPESETWFAQNYDRFLEAYDYTVVMAYPRMEQAEQPVPWLRALADVAGRAPDGLTKTIFKLQAYDWRTDEWIPKSELLKQMQAVLAAGIRHLAYYPDNFRIEKPDLDMIKLEMSTHSRPGKE